jgi:coenzyme F420-0:L-glutamate ligase / coenzyme F420-1:gamma-L-glutamate ligase
VNRFEVIGLEGIPEVVAGASLVTIILDAIARTGDAVRPHDILVVAQKIVSKAEGCEVDLAAISPSATTVEWAERYGKDARLVELALREAVRVVRMERGVLITETRHGFICANSGVDASNVRPGFAITLPRDPDQSAERIRAGIADAAGVAVGVIVSDTFGRPWREGQVNVAIGLAGVRAFADYRGSRDAFGRQLHVSLLAVADEAASAAELVMGKHDGMPVAILRGLSLDGDAAARQLLRPAAADLFR